MARVYFPTQNQIGLRNTDKQMTLGAFDFTGYRAPAEGGPHASMNPVNLGGFDDGLAGLAASPNQSGAGYWRPWIHYPLSRVRPVPPAAPALPPGWSPGAPPRSVYTGGPTPMLPERIVAPGAPPPVQVQSTPTPTVTVPPAPAAPQPVLVTSGGGSVSPDTTGLASPSVNVTTSSTASASLIDQVAAWLGGTTPIGSYNVPNALLAGGVAIVVALLMGGNLMGGKRR
jgi:hypothetical protein